MTSTVETDTPPTTSGRSPASIRGIYLANLVAQAAIVVTGAIVRITDSGLGCPTWPECVDGSIAPTATQSESWHKYIEFGNRTLTFVLTALAIAAVVAAIVDARRRRRSGLPRRPVLLLLALVPILGTVAQAVLGGITVLTGLHPTTVAAHFLLSMAIIAGVVALVVRSGDDGDRPLTWLAPRPVVVLSWILVATSALVVLLGVMVTGSGPHSGDDTAERLAIDPRTIAWLHADVVLLFIGLLIGLLVAVSVVQVPAAARRRAWLLMAVAIAQGVLGYTQYFTGLPELLVGLHVLGAVLVWIATLFIPPALRTRGGSPPLG